MSAGHRGPLVEVRATAPGRVNLMGDHTDQTGGLVLPMACNLSTVLTGSRGGDRIVLSTTVDGNVDVADVPLTGEVDPGASLWTRLVGSAVSVVSPKVGLQGSVSTDLPVGAGLSSSASVCTALVLALGGRRSPLELAALARRVEVEATGVPCGLMDQLACAAGREGHALRIDCTDLSIAPVRIPDGVDVLVVHSGAARRLAGSPYGQLAETLATVDEDIGPLRQATWHDIRRLGDPVHRRTARHVVAENARVDELAAALLVGDRRSMATVLRASHASLRDDLRTTTPAIDGLVELLEQQPGVIGARCTGAGFGGCVVALAEAGTPLPAERIGWRLVPSNGATLIEGEA